MNIIETYSMDITQKDTNIYEYLIKKLKLLLWLNMNNLYYEYLILIRINKHFLYYNSWLFLDLVIVGGCDLLNLLQG